MNSHSGSDSLYYSAEADSILLNIVHHNNRTKSQTQVSAFESKYADVVWLINKIIQFSNVHLIEENLRIDD